MATLEEWVKVLGLPGTEGGGQGELALGSLGRAGTAADLAADHQGSQGPFGEIVIRGRFWDQDEGEQLFDKVVDALAQLALDGAGVFQERGAAPEQSLH